MSYAHFQQLSKRQCSYHKSFVLYHPAILDSMLTPITTALYARISTRDKGQDPEVQLTELREYARQTGVAGCR